MLRCVLAPGDATTSVVVAVEMVAVLVRPGVITPEALSTHDAWTSVLATEDVTTLILSDVEVRRSMYDYATRTSAFDASLVGMVRVKVPAVIDCAPNVWTLTARLPEDAVL